MSDFKGKTVLVTGGSLGIGKCLAKAFAVEKAKVVICARSQEDLEKASSEITRDGYFCDFQALDVSDAKQVMQFIDSVARKYGTIDILANCAGIYGPIGPIETLASSDWEKTIQINLLGTVNCIRAVVPVMKQQRRGKIINMSGAGVGGILNPNFSAYIASKVAVAALTEVVAKELKDFNIQVNAIAPGPVNTRFLNQVLEAGENSGKEFLEKSIRQKKEGGTPPELAAQLALFLASEASDFITGKVISAKWDDYKNFIEMRDVLEKTAFGNLRRIDNKNFYEKS